MSYLTPEDANKILHGMDSIGQPTRLFKVLNREFLGINYKVRVDYTRHDDLIEIKSVCMNINNEWVEVETDQISDDEFENEITQDMNDE